MSELTSVQDNHKAVRRHLLATASALALTAYVASISLAKAGESDHPVVWIELGGQLEAMQGTSAPFSAPFMFPPTTPDVYGVQSFAWKQKAPRFAFGGEGKIAFQPEGSEWVFSAALRFGRSNSKKHTHYQGPPARYYYPSYPSSAGLPRYAAAFSDTLVSHRESHAVIDFAVGKDVGLGMLGPDSVSTFSAGVRLAEFSIKSSASIYARPDIGFAGKYADFYQYALNGQTQRNFHGIGPSLSWNASAALLGNADSGELTLDWGLNGSVLFGRQRAEIQHTTSAYHFIGNRPRRQGRNVPLYTNAYSTARSRTITVPNLGGFAGLTMRKSNTKVGLGYRADFFFGAMDTGIDVRRTSDLGFHGPFATISIGLGG